MTSAILTQSIKNLENYDFSGNETNRIYLDPENQSLYVFSDTLNSVPSNAFNKIDIQVATIYPKAISESVTAYLQLIEPELQSLLDAYLGCVHDGHNWIGQWDNDKLDGVFERLDQKPTDIGHYWDASDWFEPVKERLVEKYKEGISIEDIITSEECDRGLDGCCIREEAIDWFTQLVSELD